LNISCWNSKKFLILNKKRYFFRNKCHSTFNRNEINPGFLSAFQFKKGNKIKNLKWRRITFNKNLSFGKSSKKIYTIFIFYFSDDDENRMVKFLFSLFAGNDTGTVHWMIEWPKKCYQSV
jgi:hypothetical protein